jgi:hypothetical protein
MHPIILIILVLQLLLFFLLSLLSGLTLGKRLRILFNSRREKTNDDLLNSRTVTLMTRLKAKGLFQYGDTIPNLTINGKPAPYEVVNEKAIRIQAGIMAVLASYSLVSTQIADNWLPIQIVSVLFFIDFFLKVVVSLRLSILYQFSQWLVRKKEPEYVGAVQKRFAWSIGLILSALMVYFQYIPAEKGIEPIILCSLCIIFTTLESLFGFCAGCKLYYGLISLHVIKKPEINPACPGGTCPIKE